MRAVFNSMGYAAMTVCSLYADLFSKRLKPSEVANNTENRKYRQSESGQ